MLLAVLFTGTKSEKLAGEEVDSFPTRWETFTGTWNSERAFKVSIPSNPRVLTQFSYCG